MKSAESDLKTDIGGGHAAEYISGAVHSMRETEPFGADKSTEDDMQLPDRFRGCLLGGAAGDALGYPVEFMREADIRARYGKDGVTSYILSGGRALISDDTQMTLFTAEGLIAGGPGEHVSSVARAYSGWYVTQTVPFAARPKGGSCLMDVPELYARRAPGVTCLNAIAGSGEGYGTTEKPINASKGCGGVMRAAPAGLFFAGEDGDRMGAEIAALTHGHELGYIPAAMLTHIIRRIVRDGLDPRDAAESAACGMRILFPSSRHLAALLSLVERAVILAGSDASDHDAISALGEGWVAEETLAVAVFCAVRYRDDFGRALTAAVTHDGDSDSTGAVTGHILGAYLGASAIPERFTRDLELTGLITDAADRLFSAQSDE